MSTPLTIVDDVVAELVDAGVRCTSDPRNVAPPCVLVELDSVEPMTACTGRARLTLRAIAPGPGSGDALGWLWGPAFQALATVTHGTIARDEWTDLPILTAELITLVDWSE